MVTRASERSSMPHRLAVPNREHRFDEAPTTYASSSRLRAPLTLFRERDGPRRTRTTVPGTNTGEGETSNRPADRPLRGRTRKTSLRTASVTVKLRGPTEDTVRYSRAVRDARGSRANSSDVVSFSIFRYAGVRSRRACFRFVAYT